MGICESFCLKSRTDTSSSAQAACFSKLVESLSLLVKDELPEEAYRNSRSSDDAEALRPRGLACKQDGHSVAHSDTMARLLGPQTPQK